MQNVKETLINYIKENEDKFYRIAFSYSENEENNNIIINNYNYFCRHRNDYYEYKKF